jgi:lipoate-protein ligase A
MFYFIDNDSTNPSYNLALEQTIFDRLDRRHSYCMLWQNHNAVIVGRNQNTQAEINQPFVDAHGISVVRRHTGGGAVYHDLGNVNFTFITDADAGGELDFKRFCAFIQEALRSLGVPAEISGRNDIVVNGQKISGNAQYIRQSRVMHHGTLLYDSDLGVLSDALIANAKIESRGIKSVRSRVTNIRPYMASDMPVQEFIAALRSRLVADLGMQDYALTAEDTAAAQKLDADVYSRWDWNYGASPPHNVRKSRFVEGCGTVEAYIEADGGKIASITFYGDFFGSEEAASLGAKLAGHRLERGDLSALLPSLAVSRYFHNMDEQTFLSLLLD